MTQEIRGNLTVALWFLSALVLVALFISAAAQGEVTSAHIVLASVILAFAVTGTSSLLRLTTSDSQQAKSKRQRIDRLLLDLSDEELVELKKHLSDGNSDDDSALEYLGDDGELVRRS